jgi:hypothetical protein
VRLQRVRARAADDEQMIDVAGVELGGTSTGASASALR